MPLSLELEIQSLLNSESDPESIVEKLFFFAENAELGEQNELKDGIYTFLLNSKLSAHLIEYVVKNISEPGFVIPWGHLLEALYQQSGFIAYEIAEALWEGIQSQKAENVALRSRALDAFAPELKLQRADNRLQTIKEQSEQKKEWLQQLEVLHLQSLHQQEQKLLQKLLKMFPQDAQIASYSQGIKERMALDILSKHRPTMKTSHNFIEKNPSVQQSIIQSIMKAAGQNPQMIYDFVIAAMMMELYELGLSLIEHAPESPQKHWLKLEILLRCRRFLELLTSLNPIEKIYATESETFYATAYLRAQALWGLGQKQLAMEVMESLLNSSPHYRAGSILLTQWRTQ